MKIRFVLFLLIIVFSASALAQETGLQIMQTEEAKYNCQAESFSIVMEINKIIVMQMWIRNHDNLQDSMIKITDPATLRGTGVLTIGKSINESLQWFYLPALGRSRQIGSNKKTDRFMGSDITFGDLEPEILERWNYERLPDQEFNGQPCYVIKAKPKKQKDIKDYGYSKRLIWIQKDNFFIVQIEYYDPEDQLQKVQNNQELVLADGYWRANKIVVKNLQTGQSTILNFHDRKINPEIREDFFTERYLVR